MGVLKRAGDVIKGLFFSRSPNIESIRAKRLRGARINLSAFHQCTFELRTPGGWKKLPIVNLSVTGLAFEDRVPRDLAVGQIALGRLTLSGHEYPLELEVRHRSQNGAPGCVGTKFVKQSRELERELVQLFKREISAVHMVEVKPEVLKKEPDGSPRLYLGSDLCELYFVERGGLILRFYLNYFGNYFESEKGELRSGVVFRDEPRGKPWVRGIDLVRLEHSEPTQQSVELAASFVQNIEALSITFRDQITETLLSCLNRSGRQDAKRSSVGAAG